jgi:hypothetical protein
LSGVPNKYSLVFQESLDDGGFFFGSAFGFSATTLDLADLVRWLTPFSPQAARGSLVLLLPRAIVAMATEGYNQLTTTARMSCHFVEMISS